MRRFWIGGCGAQACLAWAFAVSEMFQQDFMAAVSLCAVAVIYLTIGVHLLRCPICKTL